MALYKNNFLTWLRYLDFHFRTYLCNYLYCVHLFIYLFSDQFPRGILGIYALWAQGKAKDLHPLWVYPRHNVSRWAYSFWPVMLSTTSLAFSCVGPVDLCWWDSFYWCDCLLFTQTVTCTTPGWRYFFAPSCPNQLKYFVLINSPTGQWQRNYCWWQIIFICGP